MLSEALLKELNSILKEDYSQNLNQNDLVEVGNNLISYFDLLLKINHTMNQNYDNKQNN